MNEPVAKASLERIRTICLFILATGVVCAGLYFLSSALVPFVIAAFFHFSLAPLVNWQRKKWKLPGWLAVTTTAIVGLIVFAGFWAVLIASLAQIAADAGSYQGKLQAMGETLFGWFPMEKVGITPDDMREALENQPGEVLRESLPGAVGALAQVFAQGTLAALFLMFMLGGKAVAGARAPQFMEEVEHSIQRYVLTKVAISALNGFCTWLILTLLGVELALVFGLMAFLLNFIPNIGSIIAPLLPLPVLLQNGYSPTTIVLALLLPAAVDFLLGNVIEPKIAGRTLGIHPVVIILSLVLFGILWGIPGMFLATPLTAVLKIMLDQHQYTKPIARILEGDLRVLGRPEEKQAATIGA
jgi:AI-2 transport protein TqsA